MDKLLVIHIVLYCTRIRIEALYNSVELALYWLWAVDWGVISIERLVSTHQTSDFYFSILFQVERFKGLSEFFLLFPVYYMRENLDHLELESGRCFEAHHSVKHLLRSVCKGLGLGSCRNDPLVVQSLLCRHSFVGVFHQKFSYEVFSVSRDVLPMLVPEFEFSSQNSSEEFVLRGSVEGRVASQNKIGYHADCP